MHIIQYVLMANDLYDTRLTSLNVVELLNITIKRFIEKENR